MTGGVPFGHGPDAREGIRATAPAAQAPILTVTLNPALDMAASTPSVVPDRKLRCTQPLTDPGGGGINISRAIARMGGQSSALAALGGPPGARIEALLADAGLRLIRIEAPGDTRESLSITDEGTGHQFRFVMPGPAWSQADVASALDAIARAAPADGIVVLSGSQPPGVPAEFAALLARRLAGSAARLFVDTSGPALAAVAAGGAPVEVLRMDEAEAEGLADRPLPGRADTAAFAAALVARGAARSVLIARGGDGNIIAGPSGRWHAEATNLAVVSAVGAGDSFVGGFALALARGWPAPLALGLGAAAASAACLTPATELCRPEDVERLFAARVVTPI